MPSVGNNHVYSIKQDFYATLNEGKGQPMPAEYKISCCLSNGKLEY